MIALALYGDEDIGLRLKGPVFTMDATTIDLCLSLFPWAHFRQTKVAVKAHVVMGLRGAIPVFISITNGKVRDVRLLDMISLPARLDPGDRPGLSGFRPTVCLAPAEDRLRHPSQGQPALHLDASRPVDATTGLRADQTILLATPKSKAGFPEHLRRVSFRAPETGKHLVFITNLFEPPALIIASIYKNRWQIELFFMWLKELGRQALLRQFDQRRQGADLDCRMRMPAGAHCHQASSPACLATDFSASRRNQYFRKNHVGSTGCIRRTERGKSPRRQPIDSFMKSTRR